ncbi:MAG: hypothetical protein ACRDOP_06600 [Gaiellaceae bacterium]
MRRLTLALAILAVAVPIAGCAGAEGREAQALLDKSNEAFAAVDTYRLGGRMSMETPFGDVGFEISAAVDQRNEAFSMRMSSADLPGGEMHMVVRGGVFWMRMDGSGWQRLPNPPPGMTGAEQFDLLPYVKDVEVDEGQTVAGEPAVKITGVLDLDSFAEGFMAGIPEGVSVDASFGDTRIVVYVSEATSLPLRMLMDQSMEIVGETTEMQMDLALTGINEPVKIPTPGA